MLSGGLHDCERKKESLLSSVVDFQFSTIVLKSEKKRNRIICL